MAPNRPSPVAGRILPWIAGVLGFLLVCALLLGSRLLTRTNPGSADFPADKSHSRCAYRDCSGIPSNTVSFDFQIDAGPLGKPAAGTIRKTEALCDDHADSAAHRRWPDPPRRGLLVLMVLVLSTLAGAAAMGLATLILRRRR